MKRNDTMMGINAPIISCAVSKSFRVKRPVVIEQLMVAVSKSFHVSLRSSSRRRFAAFAPSFVSSYLPRIFLTNVAFSRVCRMRHTRDFFPDFVPSVPKATSAMSAIEALSLLTMNTSSLSSSLCTVRSRSRYS